LAIARKRHVGARKRKEGKKEIRILKSLVTSPPERRGGRLYPKPARVSGHRAKKVSGEEKKAAGHCVVEQYSEKGGEKRDNP